MFGKKAKLCLGFALLLGVIVVVGCEPKAAKGCNDFGGGGGFSYTQQFAQPQCYSQQFVQPQFYAQQQFVQPVYAQQQFFEQRQRFAYQQPFVQRQVVVQRQFGGYGRQQFRSRNVQRVYGGGPGLSLNIGY